MVADKKRRSAKTESAAVDSPNGKPIGSSKRNKTSAVHIAKIHDVESQSEHDRSPTHSSGTQNSSTSKATVGHDELELEEAGKEENADEPDCTQKDDIDDATMVRLVDEAMENHKNEAKSSAASTPKNALQNPNDVLEKSDKIFNLLRPTLMSNDNKPLFHVKINQVNDKKYINVNARKELKQSTQKFGDLPMHSYGLKVILPFSVMSGDPLPWGQCRNRFVEGHRNYVAPAKPSVIPVPPLYKSQFGLQIRFDDMFQEGATNAFLEKWARDQEKQFLDLAIPMMMPHLNKLDDTWEKQIIDDLNAKNLDDRGANKLELVRNQVISFVRQSDKGLRYIPFKFRLFAPAKKEEKMRIEASVNGQGAPYESIWNDEEMAQVVRDSVTRRRVENMTAATQQPLTLCEAPMYAYRMLKATERTDKSGPFVERLTPARQIELIGSEKSFIGTTICQLGLEHVKDKITRKSVFKCVLEPLSVIYHRPLDEVRQQAQHLIEEQRDASCEDFDFGV